MNENLDLTKILEGCPKGTKFHSCIYGEAIFVRVGSGKDYYPIELKSYATKAKLCINYAVTKEGRKDYNFDGECTLFPSRDQRDWSKFERFWDTPKKEKFDVSTLQPYDKVLTRNNLDDLWQPNFFGYISKENPKRISCLRLLWKYCIPYNEETKHLIYAIEDCPEFYKWWEE